MVPWIALSVDAALISVLRSALLSWIRLAKTEIVEAHSRHSS